MPRKLFDEKGEPIEVLDDNEIQALKEKAQAIETLEAQYKQKEELLAKEIEELKEGMNPNWKEARKKMKAYDALRAKNKDITDEGDVIDSAAPAAVDMDKIRQETEASVRRTLLAERRTELLESYPAESREKIAKVYDKFTSGEDIQNTRQMTEFLDMAARAVGVGSPTSVADIPVSHAGYGRVPLNKPVEENFAETEHGRALASEIYGEESYTAVKK